ncbi:hypothetical protein A3E65_01040 [Candidatus Kaiserbacteria bacterium RIFCSPHIGHO2_12_FULL_56_13]|uniref:Uncharacterized protein n=1 Tax=Candidatus Kaiserbacteria bacterium RIFCSPHIGHO2_12_FULL_56_13 TaxID=1798505 RepID=A0A1F6EDM5_9BACT|nr:MAG: hypothetical protein A3E65_01040 [Candidatus Kaiserbacteria bacterium RIFCSPHIGHO2_12_FULL_56_13]
MIPLIRHLEFVRQKPEPVRRQIALGVAALLTAVIALVWFGISLATGSFALSSPPFAGAGGDIAESEAGGAETGFANLFGVAAAVVTGGDESPAHIEIVETKTSSTLDDTTALESTVLPF